jgi:hypothetical protein
VFCMERYAMKVVIVEKINSVINKRSPFC